MIQKILVLMSEFYKQYNDEPHYVLISAENQCQLEIECQLVLNKSIQLFTPVSSNARVSTFHGLIIVIVKGKDRLELA